VGVSLRGRVNLFVHANRQAVVVRPDDCRSCGLCVAACPEHAIRLAAQANMSATARLNATSVVNSRT
jgi:NAD-dependent dihydropyrimidine dehydrogenase PreA subunit